MVGEVGEVGEVGDSVFFYRVYLFNRRTNQKILPFFYEFVDM